MENDPKNLRVYLVFPPGGGTATKHQVNRIAVEESGALALYVNDASGNEICIHAFNRNSWQEVKRIDSETHV